MTTNERDDISRRQPAGANTVARAKAPDEPEAVAPATADAGVPPIPSDNIKLNGARQPTE